MLLTRAQQSRFWREWSVACHVQGWTKANGWTDYQIDNERHSMLERAGFDSLTKVDHLEGFDRVLSELAALSKPADLDAQVRQQQMPRIRALHAIRELDSKLSISRSFPSPYLQAILRDKFGHADLDRLNLDELIMVRNTLAARSNSRRHKPALAADPF